MIKLQNTKSEEKMTKLEVLDVYDRLKVIEEKHAKLKKLKPNNNSIQDKQEWKDKINSLLKEEAVLLEGVKDVKWIRSKRKRY